MNQLRSHHYQSECILLEAIRLADASTPAGDDDDDNEFTLFPFSSATNHLPCLSADFNFFPPIIHPSHDDGLKYQLTIRHRVNIA